MMRRTLLTLLLVLATTTTNAWSAVQPDVDAQTIKIFLNVSKDDAYPRRSAFEIDLAAELRRGDLAAATRALAPKYGLTLALMDRFARLCIQFALYREDAWSSDNKRSYQEQQSEREANFAEMRRALIALARDSRHLPVVVEFAATVIAAGDLWRECEIGEFTDLLAGAENAKAATWAAVTHAGSCEPWRIAGLAAFPDSIAMMWNVLDRPREYTSYTRYDQRFALLQQIERAPEILVLQGGDALAMRTAIARRMIDVLWNASLVEDGIAYFERQPNEVRKNLLEQRQPTPTIMIDALPLDLKGEGEYLEPNKTVSPSDFRVDLAAALYVAGREAEARRLYSSFPHVDKAADSQLCDLNPDGSASGCEAQYATDIALVLKALELALVRPQDDPYDLVEMELGDAFHTSLFRRSGLWLRLLRKRLNEPAYTPLLPELSSSWRADNEHYREGYIVEALDKALTPEARQRAEEFQKKVRTARTAMGLPPDFPKSARANPKRTSSIGPSAFRFAEKPVDKAAKCNASKPPRLAALPEGFALVRAERDGDTAAAISLSQNLDPAGEVSSGGYWVHVSSDGGKTWTKTFYTGLAQYFPYLVKPTSCRRMLAGDRLDVEVVRAELDRASITYPPVGLRTKGETTGLYLEVQIADLEKDSDGDLLTDIEEEHVLLDPAKPDSDGDTLNDGVDALPNVVNAKVSSETDRAMALVLGEIFGGSFGAIIEGVDKAGKPLEDRFATPRTRDHASPNRPIFIRGKASDYAGIRPPATMFVYSDEDIERIHTMTPIFHAVQLWPLVMNRNRTRGFVKWSARWVGGTIGVTRDGTNWKAEPISSWIT